MIRLFFIYSYIMYNISTLLCTHIARLRQPYRESYLLHSDNLLYPETLFHVWAIILLFILRVFFLPSYIILMHFIASRSCSTYIVYAGGTTEEIKWKIFVDSIAIIIIIYCALSDEEKVFFCCYWKCSQMKNWEKLLHKCY